MRRLYVALVLVGCQAADTDARAPRLALAKVVPAPVSSTVATTAAPEAIASAAIAPPAAPAPPRGPLPVMARVVAPAAPPARAPVDSPAPAPFAIATTGSGHACFTWRRGHASSSQCYTSIESCSAERRAAPAADELTPCRIKAHASCTQILRPGSRPERHCFGDAARCEAFRDEQDGRETTAVCVAQ